MIVQLNGQVYEITDDASLLKVCETHAALNVSAWSRTERVAKLEKLLVASTYMALKLGAVAAIVNQPNGKLDRALFVELAQMFGRAIGLNIQTQAVEPPSSIITEDAKI